ncbi:hypothetical protein [Streptomyces sp. NPDC005251]|uniref:hypothetical protein n=1 Tax=unclassified Streptomyces TaxID=2593676 RepID=UPI0033A10EBB
MLNLAVMLENSARAVPDRTAVIPLNVLLKGREIAYHLADSEAKAYLCFEGTAELPTRQEGFELHSF